MTVSALPPITGTRPAPSPTTAQAGLQGDYLTFLRMLTAQMQNQDPLNPMAASDFAVQLATFANVEQATQTNQLLSALLSRSGMADLGGWVGMEARITGGAWFEEAPVQLAPEPALGATRVTLIVRDSDGQIVDSRQLDTDVTAYSWDGQTADGETLPPGRYSFEIESHRGDELLDTAPVASYQLVREARIEAGITYLVLPGGLLVESTQVSGLRQPPRV
jgi:flagellar basal-body rod modification protein FlgD